MARHLRKGASGHLLKEGTLDPEDPAHLALSCADTPDPIDGDPPVTNDGECCNNPCPECSSDLGWCIDMVIEGATRDPDFDGCFFDATSGTWFEIDGTVNHLYPKLGGFYFCEPGGGGSWGDGWSPSNIMVNQWIGGTTCGEGTLLQNDNVLARVGIQVQGGNLIVEVGVNVGGFLGWFGRLDLGAGPTWACRGPHIVPHEPGIGVQLWEGGTATVTFRAPAGTGCP